MTGSPGRKPTTRGRFGTYRRQGWNARLAGTAAVKIDEGPKDFERERAAKVRGLITRGYLIRADTPGSPEGAAGGLAHLGLAGKTLGEIRLIVETGPTG